LLNPTTMIQQFRLQLLTDIKPFCCQSLKHIYYILCQRLDFKTYMLDITRLCSHSCLMNCSLKSFFFVSILAITKYQSLNFVKKWTWHLCAVESKLNVYLYSALLRSASNALPLSVRRCWSRQANPPARHSANTARPWIQTCVSHDMSVYSPTFAQYSLQPATAQGE